MNKFAQELKAYKKWTAGKNSLKLEIEKIEETIRPQLDQIAAIKKQLRELDYCTSCNLMIEGDGGSSANLEDYCSCILTGYPQE